MEVKKVLWPTDFSSSAEKALPYVTDLTQKYGAEIHVLYVIEDIAHHEAWYGEFEKTHIDKLIPDSLHVAVHLYPFCVRGDHDG